MYVMIWFIENDSVMSLKFEKWLKLDIAFKGSQPEMVQYFFKNLICLWEILFCKVTSRCIRQINVVAWKAQ